ncbi:type II toxin-antitoxin system RelB/DinJ family antitoxin [Adlercreutzia sp. R21]|uniref:type II toxin-antitoxin system RelB/DinJ family antitoxin n=1 Tax=Adlercreutzia wanghongyangiae TaxID=3111451 RepID=UPI002DB78EB2|nr:type II toxin-antitoxin system RelB/DinJ family antitoxin [Adlercreutzia sp. R21]MEC4184888.1 type II toxin-antitoxin system RelB/DinJ family antitoxin [Adlercreutzia sp. R21]
MSATVMEPISSKLRSDEKSAFIATCESIGTTPSNAIRMFVSAFNKRGGFPFDPANPYGFNRETLRAMEDAAEERNLIGPFASSADMWDAILSDDDE